MDVCGRAGRPRSGGLIDEVGTLRDAIAAAKKAGGMKEGEKAELLILPEPTSFFDQLLGTSAAAPAIRATVDAAAPGSADSLKQAALLRKLFAEPGVLMMPYHLRLK